MTGDDAIDLAINSKYYTELPISIYRISNEINFAQKIGDNPYRYFETVEFKWHVTKEIKIVNGVKCIKATTEKWGRNWVAYYSPKHPVPYGPYKFYGLPGLIFEIYDDKNEYTFKLYRFKNRRANNFMLFNYPKAKKVTKKQYNIIRHNYAIEPETDISLEGVPDIQKK
ncbi:MAG: GLPGLI family protein [Flavobacterium sp. JAD_PAG50586_2]|nr:MAG: GLPGLI family protein [Flavobacterium sp. JAD_PAG50586_2]